MGTENPEEVGQFDDAADETLPTTSDVTTSRFEPVVPINDEILNSDADESSDEGEGGDQYEEEEEEEDQDDAIGAVEDADWELARGDFTKQFNRSRQLASIVMPSKNAEAGPSGVQGILPAMNRPRRFKVKASANEKSGSDTNNRTMTSPVGGGAQTSSVIASHANKTDAQLAVLSKYASRIRINDFYDPSQAIGGSIDGTVPRKAAGGRDAVRVKDKADRATVEGVLDPRTLVILYKMINRGLLETINGCISTGKEANVYHATSPPPEGSPPGTESGHKAIKIYKTSILVFKDRDRYITGEHRFQHGYSRHNPRKMVRLWAEKEARNLKRLVLAGLRAPRPIELRDHVLVMDFLGDKDGWASPRLKDADPLIQDHQWPQLYRELLASVRSMYHECRLVHADLSEYNILYHEGRLWIIDVSQSVEHDHPRAFDFLRADLSHVDSYFEKRGVQTLGLRRTFEFVVREPSTPSKRKGGRAGLEKSEAEEYEEVNHVDAGSMVVEQGHIDTSSSSTAQDGSGYVRAQGETEEELIESLEHLMKEVAESGARKDRGGQGSNERKDGSSNQGEGRSSNGGEAVEEEEEDEAVFKSSYIPRTLNEVYDPERDVEIVRKGGIKSLIYAGITGMDVVHKDTVKEEEVEEEGNPGGGKANVPRVKASESNGHDEEDQEGEDDEGEEEEDQEEEEGGGEDGDPKPEGWVEKVPRGHRHEDREAKKERKKEVKEEARERRKNKMPKSEKKRRMKKSSHSK
ncbi:RIO1-domain-containing protein [Violaceomyces palustris]|uniref:RIO1-domain-containing protein n=1 Tax=Violaceomyces palustris TaxID=1673888 RepID=A0ACD0NWG4_9BASI|nr:RIO1-domain-containing protein [Violaceomyces palustris]